MHPRSYQNRQHQRGFTLMEILVAVAIFVTVMIVALLLYDRSNRIFKTTNESAEMQQNTRVAFEKVVADLRMAGFDYKRAGTPTSSTPTPWAPSRAYSSGTLVTPKTPNGHVYRCTDPGTSHATTEPTWTTGTGDIVPDAGTLRWQESGAPVFEQPDEQIEYAHSSAVTIRANFDYDEPATDNGREVDYQNGNFPVVTTGNDEIVTYALVSQSGSNTDSISFFADVNATGAPPKREAYPGGKIEREITFSGIDLSNAKPPYTLVRISLDDRGNEKRTALADNIRSMSFSYWEDAQATRALTDLDNNPIPNVGGAGAYNPASPDALVKERLIRGKVRAVTVNIVGMNPQPDYDYTNPNETLAAAKNYRQYTLQSTVVGRNLGLEGVPQSSSDPPGPPTFAGFCNGYCGVTFLSWKPDPADTTSLSYTLYYDKSSTGSFSGILPVGSQTTYAADLTQMLDEATTYYFKVAATNENGTTVSKGYVAVDLRNATKLSAPAVTVAGTSKPNELAVTWTVPTAIDSGTKSCAAGVTGEQETYTAEIKGYRVYRSTNPTFNIGDADAVKLMDETTGGAALDGTGKWVFVDKTVAACEPYYYRVQVVEWCFESGSYNTPNDVDTSLSVPATIQSGEAVPDDHPRAPQNLKPHPDNACDPDSNTCYPVILTWDPVTKDISNNDIVVLDYQIDRKKKLNGVTIETVIDHHQIQDGTTSFSESEKLDYADLVTGLKYSYEYSVYALHEYAGTGDCNKKSAAAVISIPDSCSTGATIKPDSIGGGTGTFDDPWTDVLGLQVLEGAKPLLSVEYSLDGGNTFTTLPYPYYYTHSDIADGLKIPIEFRLNVTGCTERLTVYVENDEPSCLLTGTVVNSTSSATVLDIDIKSTSSEVITISTIDITWDAQSGVAWNSITLPSPANHTATGTAAAARTVTFTPAGADKTIPINGSYKIKMNMAGTPVPYGFQVSKVVVKYTVPSTGTAPHNCTLEQLTRCSVTALANSASTFRVDVPVTNDSTEELTLSSFSINWAGQDKLQWDSIAWPAGATSTVTTATISGTEAFTPPTDDDTILGKGTYSVGMNFSKTNGNPSIDATTVGAVWLRYTTPTSGSVTMNCRAK